MVNYLWAGFDPNGPAPRLPRQDNWNLVVVNRMSSQSPAVLQSSVERVSRFRVVTWSTTIDLVVHTG